MRILRTPLGRLFLLALAVALAVLVFGQGGARPAAADLPTSPHYECYDIVGSDPLDTVKLQTQLGVEREVAVGQATKLCLPAAKDTTEIPDVPHLKCYTIDGPPPSHSMTLLTQFGEQQHVVLGRAKLLCVPAIKTVLWPSPGSPSGQLLTEPHYKCYEITSGANDPGAHMVKTQFGTVSGVDVGPSHLLCLAALKTKLPGVTPEGSLSAQDLECYTLIGQVAPGFGVKLQTQFGLEGAPPGAPIEVGPASMLCAPAVMTVSIGGIAELPALAGTSGDQAAAPGNGSGWSSASYAALAGGLAAAVVVLSAGAWYARRRWLR